MNSLVPVNTASFWMKPTINSELKNSETSRVPLSQNNHCDVSANDSFINKSKSNVGVEEKKDPLLKNPLRLCAYTNEVGAALAPIPVIGSKIFMMSWVPALMYFGADIYDKYSKGQDGEHSSPSPKNALKQTTFQALASVILPTAAVITGQNVASRISGLISKDKMDIRAKENVLTELKRDFNQEKLNSHTSHIEKLFKENPNMTTDELSQLDEVKEIKMKLAEAAYSGIKAESSAAVAHRESIGPVKKFFSFFGHSDKSCEFVSRIDADKFDSVVKPYLDKQVSDVVNTRIMLQRALDSNGTMNEHSKNLDKNMLKKLSGILEKSRANSDIADKSSYALKQCGISNLNKIAIKLSVGKIVGGFVALAILAKPVDHFVEKVIIHNLFDRKSNGSNNS